MGGTFEVSAKIGRLLDVIDIYTYPRRRVLIFAIPLHANRPIARV